MIRCIEVGNGGKSQTTCDPPDAPRETDGFVWIDVDSPSEPELRRLQPLLGLHELALEDAVDAGQRPKIERYDGGVMFVALHTPTSSVRTGDLAEVHVVVGEDFVVTISHGGGDLVERVRARSKRCALAEPAAVLHAVIDTAADDFLAALTPLEVQIRDVERNVFFPGEVCDVAPRIYDLKRDVLELWHHSEPLLVPLNRLVTDLGRSDDPLAPYFRDVVDHLGLVVSRLERMRDLLTDALDANLARLTVRQNEDMRKMSAWGAMFLLPTILVGMWGMNFEHMPELDEPWGYPGALAAIVGSCAVLYWRLRKAGWL